MCVTLTKNLSCGGATPPQAAAEVASAVTDLAGTWILMAMPTGPLTAGLNLII